jgi:septal ring factor EnvC (AmiA/AmiB activator)
MFFWRLLLVLTLGLSFPAMSVAETAKTAHNKAAGKTAAKQTGSVKKAAQKKPAAKKSATKRSSKQSKTAASPKNDLERVNAQISSTEKRIQLTREQREQKEAELRQAEQEIGEIKGSMGSVQKDVNLREQSLQSLRDEEAARTQDKEKLLAFIRADLQMAQRQGRQDSYKLLLNQQDPAELARLMKYYGYLQGARATRVTALNSTIARLNEISTQKEKEVQQLQSLRSQLQEKRNRLVSAQAQRNASIQSLNAQLLSEDEKLKKLKQDQQALQAVMERLQREAVRQQQAEASKPPHRHSSPGNTDTPPPRETQVREMPYQGRCTLPVGGNIRARFGSARAGGLRWNGIVVSASAGTPVHAVRAGRVAFADYLRGYGFLVIVDHGRGLMSLYGQNQSLQKRAGDSVNSGEVIASVGDSGGNSSDGLYFEIRVQGKPVDPANWCAYQ